MKEQFHRVLVDARLVPPEDNDQLTNTYSNNLELVKVRLRSELRRVGWGVE